MSDPTTKDELLARMRDGYAAFDALLSRLNPTQLTTPGVNGEWTVKDILVHLTAWQDRVSLRLEAEARGEEANLEPVANDEQMNAFNDATFAANRSRPLEIVLEEFRASVSRLERNTESLSEREIFEAGSFPWLRGDALVESIAGNSYGHYDEHIPMIEGWLADH